MHSPGGGKREGPDPKAGLSQLAAELQVERIGPCHQAGSAPRRVGRRGIGAVFLLRMAPPTTGENKVGGWVPSRGEGVKKKKKPGDRTGFFGKE